MPQPAPVPRGRQHEREPRLARVAGPGERAGSVYAGVEPAALFRSEDGGDSWTDVPALTKHPTRDQWQPGAGGLILHSIVLDESRPERMWLGISAAGVFRTDDAGETWEPLRKGLPDRKVYLHCLREGMTTDGLDPVGVYVGTTSGQVFFSRDEGDNWDLLIDSLPPINSVDAATLA